MVVFGQVVGHWHAIDEEKHPTPNLAGTLWLASRMPADGSWTVEIAPGADKCALAVLPDGVPHLDLEAGAHHVVLGHVHEAHRLRQQNLE